MSKSGGISGVAVAAVAAGALLVVAGVRNSPIREALRDILSGRAPVGREPVKTPVTGIWKQATGTAGPGSPDPGQADPGSSAGNRGAAIAAAARTWLGTPYKWGGTERTGVDCSGLVYRCLQAAGVTHNRLTSYGYRSWSGAKDIPKAQCAAGDLVIYTGHIGIATSNTTMIHASGIAKPTHERSIYNGNGGPIIRRVMV
jgi:cell wall-associated NlpC family hydrolase